MENQKSFKPYVPAEKTMPEFTPTAIIIGAILAIVFGGANAYLGLRVGMTVSASIPAAVISMGIIRKIMKKDSILENNMVQTIGSAGESLAAGAIFTLPAVFMWANEGMTDTPSILFISAVAFCGGIMGTLLMVPLRNALIVEEHGVLPYPEGTACAEVLIAGEEGGAKTSIVFSGLGIAAIYKFIADGFKLFPSEVDFDFSSTGYVSGVGMDVLPALGGVGYICGPKVASYITAGGVIAWFVIIPLIALFGGDSIMFPADVPISELGVWGIWNKYIRYVGAGAVAAGGIMSLIKSLPMIFKTFAEAIKVFGKKSATISRTSKDLPMSLVLGGSIVMAFVMWLLPFIPVSLLGAFMIIIFGFFFATVSSRMVGIVGSSNNPVSGMAIATLLITTIILKTTGTTGITGMVSAITIGSIICIIASMAGDTSQDLKTGFILGATPQKQQIGELIGALVSALAIGGILYLLHQGYGYGSSELPAPQATLMKLVIEGVMDGNLPWGLVFVGVFLSFVIEMLGIPVLPFAIGVYLPVHLSTPIMLGALVRLWVDKKKFKKEETRRRVIDYGLLYSSGMIAGEGLIGIALAALAVIPFKTVVVEGSETTLSLANFIGEVLPFRFEGMAGNIAGLVFFSIIILSIVKYTVWHKDNREV